MKRLIVNADDFGLTPGVNRAIVELHRQGLLSSATLMARAAATDEAIELAHANPTLGVGCHVVLVDGQPVLDPRQDIPNLSYRSGGRFYPTLGSFLSQIHIGKRQRFHDSRFSNEIQVETAAQLGLLRGRGLRLTHIDTHKHTHMFPAVLRPVLRAAHAAGIRRVRNPFEPAWSRKATPSAPWVRRIQVQMLHVLERAFRRILAEEGFTTTDGAVGVLATGTLDRSTISSLLLAMPPGTWELVTHPGYNDRALAEASTRLLASRETEMHALRALAAESDVQLVDFGQLPEQS